TPRPAAPTSGGDRSEAPRNRPRRTERGAGDAPADPPLEPGSPSTCVPVLPFVRPPRRTRSDEGIFAAPAVDDDLVLIFQAPDDLDDSALGLLDVLHPDLGGQAHLLAQHLGRAPRH